MTSNGFLYRLKVLLHSCKVLLSNSLQRKKHNKSYIAKKINRRDLFFELLGEELSKEGFEYKKSLNGFSKKENGNTYVYTFEIWPMFFQIDPKFRILIKEVQEVKKKVFGKGYNNLFSVGNHKHQMIPKEESSTSWTETEADVRKAVKREIDFYYSNIKEYYKKFSDVKFLDEYLNTKPYEYRCVAFNFEDTYKVAIIVAMLNNNPKLKELIDFYKPFYKTYNQGNTQDYDQLAEYVLNRR